MATQNRKVVLLEMNEVPYRVIDHFASARPHSNIAKLLKHSRQFETICEDQIGLEPWIAWSTVHRGVIDQQHRVLHLGHSVERANREHPPVWELIARNHRTVGVFGSLHSSTVPADLENYKFYIPDFFADRSFSYPASLEAFQKFNLLMTRRSARNVDAGIPFGPALAFLRQYASAMSWSTLWSVLSVLATERRHPHLKCRRRSLQPLIGMDLFLRLMRKTQPDFATFYTNHVAANMHRFWAAAFPQDTEDNSMSIEWRHKYEHEIEFAVQALDQMLGRLMTFADKSDYLILIASGIGQSAIPSGETSGFLTITDVPRFMTSMGLTDGQWQQRHAMVPCVSVTVDPTQAAAFEEKLRSLVIGQRSMVKDERESGPFSYDRRESESFQLVVYFEEYKGEPSAQVGTRSVPLADLGLGILEHEDNVACSAHHTPFGSFIVYDPRQKAASMHRATISTIDIIPAVLSNFGIQTPEYMRMPDQDLLDVTRDTTSITVRGQGGGVGTHVSLAGVH